MVTRYTSETYHYFGPATERAAMAILGQPYAAGGRGPDKYDCWGVVMAFYDAAGIWIPDPHTAKLEDICTSGIFHHFRRVDAPDYGDVAVFATANEDKQHVGVVFFGGVLHAVNSPVGVICVPADRLKIREYYRNINIHA